MLSPVILSAVAFCFSSLLFSMCFSGSLFDFFSPLISIGIFNHWVCFILLELYLVLNLTHDCFHLSDLEQSCWMPSTRILLSEIQDKKFQHGGVIDMIDWKYLYLYLLFSSLCWHADDGQERATDDAPENNPLCRTVYVGNLAPEVSLPVYLKATSLLPITLYSCKQTCIWCPRSFYFLW